MRQTQNTNKNGTFLVIDDEPDILEAIKRLFRKEYNVLTTTSVAEAWKIIASEDVQVVMTDQRMPKTSGIEFLAELRTAYPQIVRVLFTGYSNISDVIDAINEGHIYRYISKPWKPAELQVFVAQAFEYYRNQQEREDLMERLRAANETLELQNKLLNQANEELKLLDRVKNVFMEVVSHELNTPIAIIFGYTFLLRKELSHNISPVLQKTLNGIDSSAVRLKNISNRIFQMLADDGPTSTLELKWVDLNQFVRTLQDQVMPFLQKRAQTLEIQIDPSANSLMADEAKLTDICLNLLMNAIKFSHDGQSIVFDINLDEKNPQMLIFSVKDSGIGISEDDLEQIFTTFFSTFKTSYHSSGQFEFGKRGIGLGLPVAKRFTEMHGGHIEVDSKEGRGSLFKVYLPIEPAIDIASKQTMDHASAQHARH